MKVRDVRLWIALGVCLVVVLGWFSPWWLGGRNLAPLDLLNGMMSPWRAGHETHAAKNHIVSDGVDQYLIYRMIAERSYRDEGWVGWSSLTYGGTAQYANTMALYYDWTMQLHRWFGFWTAWHLGLMMQVLIAAWGMLLFLRGRAVGWLWACCGALAYAANSQFVTWIYHRWALGAFCWVPWILWSIDAYRNGRRRHWALVPMFLCMAFLGGTLQHAALVVLAVMAMWGEEALGLKGVLNGGQMSQAGHPSGASDGLGDTCAEEFSTGCGVEPAGRRRSPWCGQLGLLGRYAVWGLAGVGLAAMMFLPCADAFLTSNRLGLHMGLYGHAEGGVYPEGWLQPVFNLAAYPLQIFPSILGRCNSVDVLRLFKSGLLHVAYFGSLPVLVALVFGWRRGSPLVGRLLIGCGLLLPLTPLVRVLYQRLYLLFILGGILAFVHFMQSASRETRVRVVRTTGAFAGAGVAAWTVMSVLLQFSPGVIARLREKILAAGSGSTFAYFTDWMGSRADRFIHDLAIWSPQQWMPLVLLGLALGGLRLTASLQERWRSHGAWLVAAAVIGEVSLFGSRWVVWSDPGRYPLFPPTRETAALQEMVGHNGRVTTLIHPTAHMACTPFIPNTLAPYGIATICGYDSIIPEGMVLPNEAAGDAERLGRCGVSHLLTWSGNPEVPEAWKPVWKSLMMEIYENTMAMPGIMGFANGRGKDAFFSGERPEFVAIHETSGKENSRTLDVPGGVCWIRIAENQGDGWEYRAGVSAAWQPVGRAADASMLLENPDPGKPVLIDMRYNPPLRRIGFMISGCSLALVMLGAGIAGVTRRSVPCGN